MPLDGPTLPGPPQATRAQVDRSLPVAP